MEKKGAAFAKDSYLQVQIIKDANTPCIWNSWK